jgi:hypothetical protein
VRQCYRDDNIFIAKICTSLGGEYGQVSDI